MWLGRCLARYEPRFLPCSPGMHVLARVRPSSHWEVHFQCATPLVVTVPAVIPPVRPPFDCCCSWSCWIDPRLPLPSPCSTASLTWKRKTRALLTSEPYVARGLCLPVRESPPFIRTNTITPVLQACLGLAAQPEHVPERVPQGSGPLLTVRRACQSIFQPSEDRMDAPPLPPP